MGTHVGPRAAMSPTVATPAAERRRASLALEELVHVTWGDAAGALVIALIIAREGWASVQVARSNASHRP